MKKLLTSAFLLILASVSGLTQDKERPAGKVEYSVDDDSSSFHFNTLRASANGKTYQLIDKSKKMCLQVIDQRDFDGNGFVDVPVSHIVACGGNCCQDGFFFVSNFGGGRFELGVATLGRRSSGWGEGAPDPLRCGRTNSDRSPRSSRRL